MEIRSVNCRKWINFPSKYTTHYNDMRLCWNMERLIQITQHCLSNGDPLNPFSSHHHPFKRQRWVSPTRKCIRFNQRRFQPGSFVNSTLLQIYITMKSSWRVDRKMCTIPSLSTHHLKEQECKENNGRTRHGLLHCWCGSWKIRAIILFLRTPFKLSGQESRDS